MEKYIHGENLALFKKTPRGSAQRVRAQSALEVVGGRRSERRVLAELKVMNRKGIDFTLVQIESGSWKWRFLNQARSRICTPFPV
jgi:hypothetical protein